VSPDWALMRRILTLLAGNDGLSDAELAALTCATAAEVRQAARILYHQRKLDRCWDYNVLPARARRERRAA
jgi:hypothetical protein